MIESPIEDWVCDRAEAAGWIVRKLKWVGRRNGMDRFFLKEGRIVLIEFKRPGGERRVTGPRVTQKREIDLFREAGAEVHVVDSPLAGLRVLGIDYA